jgi:hypothetical protein
MHRHRYDKLCGPSLLITNGRYYSRVTELMTINTANIQTALLRVTYTAGVHLLLLKPCFVLNFLV